MHNLWLQHQTRSMTFSVEQKILISFSRTFRCYDPWFLHATIMAHKASLSISRPPAFVLLTMDLCTLDFNWKGKEQYYKVSGAAPCHILWPVASWYHATHPKLTTRYFASERKSININQAKYNVLFPMKAVPDYFYVSWLNVLYINVQVYQSLKEHTS